MSGKHRADPPNLGYMIPRHCDGSCGLQHDVPFPFEMTQGRKWGRHVARTVTNYRRWNR